MNNLKEDIYLTGEILNLVVEPRILELFLDTEQYKHILLASDHICVKKNRGEKDVEENQIIIQKGLDDAERERVLTTMGEVAYYEVYEFHKIDGIQIITKDYIINSFGEYIEVD